MFDGKPTVFMPIFQLPDANALEVRERILAKMADLAHLTTHIGQIKLVRLTPQQLQLCYARMLDGGLSKRTVNLAHTLFKQALGDAFTLELVPRNVAAMVKPPRAVRPGCRPACRWRTARGRSRRRGACPSAPA